MHKGIFGLCTCALVKPFGHFLVGLVFDFWRDVGRDRGHRTNQHRSYCAKERSRNCFNFSADALIKRLDTVDEDKPKASGIASAQA